MYFCFPWVFVSHYLQNKSDFFTMKKYHKYQIYRNAFIVVCVTCVYDIVYQILETIPQICSMTVAKV